MVDEATILNVLLWFRSHLFDASHEELVHDLPSRLSLINFEAFRDGVVSGEELRCGSGQRLVPRCCVVNRRIYLLHICGSVLFEEVEWNENLICLQIGVFGAETSDLALASCLALEMPSQLLCRQLRVAVG